MFVSINLLCCFIFCGILAMASNLDELKKQYVGFIMDCAHQYPVTASDIDQLKKKQISDNQNVKCLLACTYKKAGMMNEQGNLSVDGVNAISHKYLHDDPVQMKKAEDFTEACKNVNDEIVSDEAQGCDRAALIFKCSVEKAPEFQLAN